MVDPGRSKKGARIYFGVFSVIFFVLFLDSVISLGAFGVVQKRVTDFSSELPKDSRCILFGSAGTNPDGTKGIWLSKIGSCAFTLWGQISIMIVSFVWLAYSVVLLAFGARVLSLPRILDFVVLFVTFLLSFSISITLSAGLNKTCGAFDSKNSCAYSAIKSCCSDATVFFYEPLHSAESSSWIATILLFCLTVWNLILMVVYCKHRSKEREDDRARLHDPPSETHSTSPPESDEELSNIAGSSKKKPNPFSELS